MNKANIIGLAIIMGLMAIMAIRLTGMPVLIIALSAIVVFAVTQIIRLVFFDDRREKHRDILKVVGDVDYSSLIVFLTQNWGEAISIAAIVVIVFVTIISILSALVAFS